MKKILKYITLLMVTVMCASCEEKILDRERLDELREYAQYEVLKKKFENYNPREKYGI